MRESDIVYEKADYWVTRVRYGYDVYKNGVTHSTRVAQIGYKGEQGLARAKAEIERRLLNQSRHCTI